MHGNADAPFYEVQANQDICMDLNHNTMRLLKWTKESEWQALTLKSGYARELQSSAISSSRRQCDGLKCQCAVYTVQANQHICIDFKLQIQ
jgi:hypothetical protein